MHPCGIVYSIKFNLHVESHRDFMKTLVMETHSQICGEEFCKRMGNTWELERSRKFALFTLLREEFCSTSDENVRLGKAKKPNSDHSSVALEKEKQVRLGWSSRHRLN